jgi:hypothetical protein
MSGRCSGCARPRLEATAHCVGCGHIFASASCANHRDRVADRACLVCGELLCSSCRRGGRHSPSCAAHEHIPIFQGWAEVCRYQDEVTAGLAANLLHSHGVEANVLSQKDRWHVVSFGGLAIVRLLARAHQYDKAAAILNDDLDDPGVGK